MTETASVEDGYTYGDPSISTSPVTLEELRELKASVGFTDEDRQWLRQAGGVLDDQVRGIVTRWRSEIIASIPHLARHSRSQDGTKLPGYLAKSNLRFEQWILDSCLREYDQQWLNYQHEIALRHTSLKKNQTDRVESTPFVPYRDIVAFSAALVDTMKPYLAAKGHPGYEVDAMHRAWAKSVQLQIALWSRTYMDLARTNNEW
ncbi:MAG TPA: protoglobin domain-containing protein [Acidobacteriaceae bacterium]|nr:protoglobin domain-containing protein [Acidobacteriaceae bacterium]